MTVDTLLTLLALLTAVYAVLSRTRRLDVSLRLRWLDWLIAIVALLLAHYLLFYPFFMSIGCAVAWPVERASFPPRDAAYLLVVAIIAFLIWRSRRGKLPRHKIGQFRDLVTSLLADERYADVVALLENHLDRVIRIRDVDFLLPGWRCRLERLSVPLWERGLGASVEHQLPESGTQRASLSDKVARWFRSAVSWVARLLPSGKGDAEVAEEIVTTIMLSRTFTTAIARFRPYFAFKLLSKRLLQTEDFLDGYLGSLLSEPDSILYFEVKNNQDLGLGYMPARRYEVPTSNRLLHFFLSDARVAKRHMIWKPIGEELIRALDELRKTSETDPYNGDMGDYGVRGKWTCPLYVGIAFFDIMVSEALYQGIQWHMFLWYFEYFVARIVRNSRFDASKLEEPDSECPTRYSYLLYEIVSTLCHWIVAATTVPSQDNVRLAHVDLSYETWNIPKSSIIALNQCLCEILPAQNVSSVLKESIMGMVFRLYFGLRAHKETEEHARVLALALKQKERGSTYESDDGFRRAVLGYFEGFDKNPPYPHEHVKELREFLQE